MRSRDHGRGGVPDTALGVLRRELAHAIEHQSKVGAEWDRTLTLIRRVDFEALGPDEGTEALVGEVEIWHELTLEPVRHISVHGALIGLSNDPEEAYGYLHRVFVGTEPAQFLDMCDVLDGQLRVVLASDDPHPKPHLRDMFVELMEMGVRSSTRSAEWLGKRVRDLDPQR